MDSSVWMSIGVICVIVWGAIIWEMWNAPLMPDDYDIDDKYIEDKLNNKKGKKNGTT